jgi:hypothetical protein
MQAPTKSGHIVNLKTARALGLAVPSSRPGRAGKLIEEMPFAAAHEPARMTRYRHGDRRAAFRYSWRHSDWRTF